MGSSALRCFMGLQTLAEGSLMANCRFTFLIGGLEHFLFFHILGIVTPTDFHIFQRG